MWIAVRTCVKMLCFRPEGNFGQAASLKHKISLKCVQDLRGAADLKGKQTVILLTFLPCGCTYKNTSCDNPISLEI